jgi:hypothetical protein
VRARATYARRARVNSRGKRIAWWIGVMWNWWKVEGGNEIDIDIRIGIGTGTGKGIEMMRKM